jgi:type II secretory pathway component GspD/PulD (secretin)
MRLVGDRRTNSIVVTGKPETVSAVEAMVKSLDIPTRAEDRLKNSPLVQIELLVIETERPGPGKSDAETKQTPLLTAAQLKKQLNLSKPGSTAAAKNVAARIDSLESRGQLRVTRRALLNTLSGKRGSLNIGSAEPTIAGVSMSEFGRNNSVSYQNLGFVLKATPQVAPCGAVTLDIEFSESHFGPKSEGVVLTEVSGRVPSRSRRTAPPHSIPPRLKGNRMYYSYKRAATAKPNKDRVKPKKEAAKSGKEPAKPKKEPGKLGKEAPKPKKESVKRTKESPKPKRESVIARSRVQLAASSVVRMASGHVTVLGGLSNEGDRNSNYLILVSAKVIDN